MRYKINQNQKQPAYLQLYMQLREDITEGYYPYGMRLPSKRLLAEESETSVITVEHAYGLLADEGYVEARQRSGYYVIYREKDSFAFPREEHIGAGNDIDYEEQSHALLSENEKSGLFPFSVFAKTMRRVLSNYGEKILERSENQGIPVLRAEIAAYLRRSRGITVSPGQIWIGSGAEYLYGLVVQMLGRDRIFALESPSYEKIQRVYESNGATCEFLKLGTAGIHSSELERNHASVLHVTPFNSYPSGITATASKRHEYIRWAERRNAFIIEDDYASEFTDLTKSEDTLFSMEPNRHVIYINTFSETIAASMRMGYLLLPAEYAAMLSERIGFYSCSVPVFEQYVLAEFIRQGDFERHINRIRRKRRQRGKGQEVQD